MMNIKMAKHQLYYTVYDVYMYIKHAFNTHFMAQATEYMEKNMKFIFHSFYSGFRHRIKMNLLFALKIWQVILKIIILLLLFLDHDNKSFGM